MNTVAFSPDDPGDDIWWAIKRSGNAEDSRRRVNLPRGQ